MFSQTNGCQKVGSEEGKASSEAPKQKATPEEMHKVCTTLHCNLTGSFEFKEKSNLICCRVPSGKYIYSSPTEERKPECWDSVIKLLVMNLYISIL